MLRSIANHRTARICRGGTLTQCMNLTAARFIYRARFAGGGARYLGTKINLGGYEVTIIACVTLHSKHYHWLSARIFANFLAALRFCVLLSVGALGLGAGLGGVYSSLRSSSVEKSSMCGCCGRGSGARSVLNTQLILYPLILRLWARSASLSYIVAISAPT